MKNVKDFTKRHPLPVYFILVFIISTVAILMLTGPNRLPASDDLRMVVGMGMLFGPSIAGILMTGLISGRAGFRELLSRLRKWRVGARWYAVALLIAPLSTIIVNAALSFFSPEFAQSIFPTNDTAALLIQAVTVGILVAICEELGWTGFAIPQMRLRYSLISTGVSLGLIWGLWHFLLFWEGDSFSGAFPLALLLGRLFSWLPAYRALMVWVYDHTESLLVAMLMHFSMVFVSIFIAPALSREGLLTSILVRGAVLWIMAAVVAVAVRKPEPVKLPIGEGAGGIGAK